MTRRLLAALLAALCAAQGAKAAWLPGLNALPPPGEALALTLTARVDQAQDLSEKTMEALASLLPRTQLQLTTYAAGGEEHMAARLTVDESPLMTFSLHQGPDDALAAVNGRAYAAPAGTDPLAGLPGETPFTLPPVPGANWARAFSGDLPDLWAKLDAYAQAEARSRTLKAAGTARRQVRYRPTQEAWAAAWPGIAQALTDALLAPGPANALSRAWLNSLRFDGPVDLRLFTARDETPLGWQFTGMVLASGYTPRKVTLLLSHAPDKGLHLSLRAKAPEGPDDLSLRLTLLEAREKDRGTLKGDAAFQWRVDKQRDAGSARVHLTARDTQEGEAVGGVLSLDMPQRGSRPRRVTRLEPKLLLSEGALTGTVGLTQKEAGRDALSMTLNVHLRAQPHVEAGIPPDAVRLKALDAAGLSREADALQTALLQPLTALLLTLPEGQRLALIHDMGRTARTRGASVSPIDNYQVIGDTANEEEIP